MKEAEQNHLPAPADAEATLVTPRFDATETQEAQPVVPLAQVRARRRIWPLLLLAALLGGAVSLCALYLYERPRAQASTASDAVRAANVPTPANAELKTDERAVDKKESGDAEKEAQVAVKPERAAGREARAQRA